MVGGVADPSPDVVENLARAAGAEVGGIKLEHDPAVLTRRPL